MADMFAPPTADELFAPPSAEELNPIATAPKEQAEMFAPPKQEELFAPPTPAEVSGDEGTLTETKDIQPAELQQIAAKHGINAGELSSMAPYYGGFVAGQSTPLKNAAGFVSESLGGIPTWIYKKFQEPRTRAALDDLRDLSWKRKSTLQAGAEMLAPAAAAITAGVLTGGAAPAAATGLAATAAEGAAYGVGGSREGEELQGAAVGAGLGAAGHGVGRLIGRLFRSSPAEEKLAGRVLSPESEVDIQKGASEIARRTEKSEQIMERELQTLEKPKLTDEEVEVLLNEQLGPEESKRASQQLEELRQEHGKHSERLAESDRRLGASEESLRMIDRNVDAPRQPDMQFAPEGIEKDIQGYEGQIQEALREKQTLESRLRRTSEKGGDTSDIRDAIAAANDNVTTLESRLRDVKDESFQLDRYSDHLDKQSGRVERLRPGAEKEFLGEFEKGAQLRERAPLSEQALRREIAEGVVENRVRQVARRLENSDKLPKYERAMEIIWAEQRRKPEDVLRTYRSIAAEQMGMRYLKESGRKVTSQKGWFGKVGDFFSDMQYVAQDIDNRTGTQIAPLIADLNSAYNKSTYLLGEQRRKFGALFRENNTVNGEIRNGTLIYDALENPALYESLTSEQRKAADGFRKYFADMREAANSGRDSTSSLEILERTNYVPHYSKPTSEIVPMIEQRMRQVGDLHSLSAEELSNAQGPLKELVEFARWGDNKAVLTDGAKLDKALRDKLYGIRDGSRNLDILAKSAQERTGGTPAFLLERNLYKLADMYSANTIRAMYLGDGIQKLRGQIDLLRKAGASIDAAYLERHLGDIKGVREGTAASAVRDLRTNYNRGLDRAIEAAGGPQTTQGAVLTSAKAIPDIFRELSLQIYPNMIGFNIRSALQNLTGGLTKLAPEMGGGYGYQTYLKAGMMSVRNFSEQLQKVRSRGLLPEGFVREGEEAIAEGMQQTALYRMTRATLDGMSKAAMSLHQMTESMNRVITLNAGEIMGREIQAGSKGAISALGRFPRAIQRAVADNPERAGEILSAHLNNVTQYNYNRIAMSEFGRTMGPLFSVFSKWPTATAGDMLHTIREKGLLRGSARNAEKYILPALFLHTISMAVTGTSDPTEVSERLSDRQKQVLGGKGLVQAAPVGNAVSILKGETGVPPAIAMAYQGMLKPILNGETPNARRASAEFVQSFAPFAGIFRFITQDLVTLGTGRKATGDFFERSSQGVQEIVK